MANQSQRGRDQAKSPQDQDLSIARIDRPLRFAVVGLGHFAQDAILPAFGHDKEVCDVVALVSSDAKKMDELAAQLGFSGIKKKCGYDGFEELLRSGDIDAVYIALPNSMHRDYAVQALRAGIHVLCEKPMAMSVQECEDMISAAVVNNCALMIAYRLHFESANLNTLELVRNGTIGEPRLFTSTFCFQAKEGNNRLQRDLGGGPLWDIGLYCINAARTLFGTEPIEVFAFAGNSGDARFNEVDESLACLLRFPGDRVANFSVSFGASNVSAYSIVGTKGDIRLEPAYTYSGEIVQYTTVEGDTTEASFEPRDQIAPELYYFCECIRDGKVPEPSGKEGLADVRIIEALLRSAETRAVVQLGEFHRNRHPSIEQEYRVPPPQKPRQVDVQPPKAS